MEDTQALVPAARIEAMILVLRGEKVILDAEIAGLYGVETRAVVQAVKRNHERFPEDFLFQLTQDEVRILRSQSVISSWGGRRHLPYAFTEQGVAMLSSVLRSGRCVDRLRLTVAEWAHPGPVIAPGHPAVAPGHPAVAPGLRGGSGSGLEKWDWVPAGGYAQVLR